MRLYKKEVEIEGYGIFEKIASIDKEHWLFCIKYPRLITSKVNAKATDVSTCKYGAVEIDEVIGKTMEEAEREWQIKIDEFESIGHKFRLVIKYNLGKDTDYQDGSGTGIFFNWGVFKEVELRGKTRWFFMEGAKESKPILDAWHKPCDDDDDSEDKEINDWDYKNWATIEWTKEREEFFQKISTAITGLRENLNLFISNIDDAITKQLQLNPGV